MKYDLEVSDCKGIELMYQDMNNELNDSTPELQFQFPAISTLVIELWLFVLALYCCKFTAIYSAK